MKKLVPSPLLALLTIALVAGCAVPSIYGIEDSDLIEFDPTLVGTWWTGDEEDVQYTVSAGDEGTYDIFAREEMKGEVKTLQLTGVLARIAGKPILDVSLAKDELEKVGENYGMLLLPVHQFYWLEHVEEGIRFHTLDDKWIADWPGTLNAGDAPIVAAKSRQLAKLLGAALRDDDAWEDAFVLRRRE